MRHRKLLPTAAALLLLAGLAQAAPASAAGTATAAVPSGAFNAVPSSEAGAVPSSESDAVTLITGDRVLIGPDGGVHVDPGSGRAKIPMLTSTVSGHTRVVPADAVPLLRRGRLDPRLFDVTALLADGYDDRRADLPVIASTDSGVTGTVVHRMSALKATALHTRKRDLGTQWKRITGKNATGKVWLDAVGHFTGSEGVQQIGATQAWQQGLTGRGMTVALIDSGVDTTHPDLAGKVTAQMDFTPVTDGGAPTSADVHDLAGHGTAVASIMAGDGAASDGRYRGVAPDASIVSAKAGDWDVSESSVIAAMEWAAGTEHAAVVNMSLGFPDAPGDDPVETALNGLTAQYGTLFVVASGNDGDNGNDVDAAEDYDVGSPGTADAALTVGAVDHDDQLAAFSSRGPRIGDDAVKPDITAPGVDVTGARSADSRGSGPYVTNWGTSEAAPHVTAAAILLKQQHPDWTAAMLKQALMGTARPAAGVGVFAQGAGRVDIPDALAAPVLADPPSVSFGDVTAPATRTVTYRNPGSAAQTLHLAMAGAFGLSASSLTVPAGGSAPVTISAAGTGTAGPYSGHLTATTAGGTTVTTPIGLIRPAVTHTLTLHHVGVDGEPTLDYYTLVVGLDTPYVYDSLYHYTDDYGPDQVISVPSGHYAIVSQLFSDGDSGRLTYLARPSLTVTGDTSLTLDERAGQPLRVSVPDADAVRTDSAVQVGIRDGSGGWVTYGGSSNAFVSMYTAQLGAAGDPARVVSKIGTALADGTTAYQLAWFTPGGLPTGLTRTVTAAGLAVEHVSARAQAPTGDAYFGSSAALPGYPLPPAYTTSPLVTTRYLNTDGGISWTSEIVQYADEGTVLTSGSPVVYAAGTSYSSTWNAPVVAPCPTAGNGWTGDQLAVRVGPFCDSAGHPGTVDQQDPPGTTTLYRDGVELASSDVPGHALFTAPPTAGSYRLNVDATRAASFGLSTHVTADWTFTDPSAAAHLPALRLTPAGTAPAGQSFTVPIAGDATALTVQASADDGTTWQPVAVTRTPAGTFVAVVQNPSAAGYVSLRLHATGGAATLDETIIHAYQAG